MSATRPPWPDAGQLAAPRRKQDPIPAMTVESKSQKSYNTGEAIRFFFSGVSSTVCNIVTVYVVRHWFDYNVAVLFGMLAGFLSSFVFTKLFAFRSHQVSKTQKEFFRFCLVYAVGITIYYLIATASRNLMVTAGVPLDIADGAGVILGGAVMAITSYFGHRFFTYRTG
jgi:putative flippase GtrA